MESCNIWRVMATALAVVALLCCMAPPSKAQQQTCASDLLPCADYLNNTDKPSDTCCTAIKQTVANQLPCLCALYTTPGLLKSLGANTTSAFRIATACGVDSVGVDKCKVILGQAPTVSPPTAVPGSDGSSGPAKIAWTGLPALLLFWVSLMYY